MNLSSLLECSSCRGRARGFAIGSRGSTCLNLRRQGAGYHLRNEIAEHGWLTVCRRLEAKSGVRDRHVEPPIRETQLRDQRDRRLLVANLKAAGQRRTRLWKPEFHTYNRIGVIQLSTRH